MHTNSLDLVYLDSDPRTQKPSACISVKSAGTQDFAGVKADRLITVQCMNFLELDSEIRRLYAELDEIRARAKKKFYKQEAMAMSAGAGAD